MKIREVLQIGRKILENSNTDSANLDAEVLLRHVLTMTREQLIISYNDNISDNNVSKYYIYLEKAVNDYPISYITNIKEFMSLDFYVDENVLIPRNDTEILVENVIKSCKKSKNIVLLDMCTGSGCIAISLAKYIENARVLAIDISNKALEIAKKNAKKNNVYNRIEFYQSDRFNSLNNNLYNSIDIIISNPPYIQTKEIQLLKNNVKKYEPILALDGGKDGLDFYETITKESYKFLKKYGKIFYEIGYDQGKDVKDILEKNCFKNIKILKDLSKKDRIVIGEK